MATGRFEDAIEALRAECRRIEAGIKDGSISPRKGMAEMPDWLGEAIGVLQRAQERMPAAPPDDGRFREHVFRCCDCELEWSTTAHEDDIVSISGPCSHCGGLLEHVDAVLVGFPRPPHRTVRAEREHAFAERVCNHILHGATELDEAALAYLAIDAGLLQKVDGSGGNGWHCIWAPDLDAPPAPREAIEVSVDSEGDVDYSYMTAASAPPSASGVARPTEEEIEAAASDRAQDPPNVPSGPGDLTLRGQIESMHAEIERLTPPPGYVAVVLTEEDARELRNRTCQGGSIEWRLAEACAEKLREREEGERGHHTGCGYCVGPDAVYSPLTCPHCNDLEQGDENG